MAIVSCPDKAYFPRAMQAAAGAVDGSAELSPRIQVLEDFYMTDAVSRASPTMAKCVAAVRKERTNKYHASSHWELAQSNIIVNWEPGTITSCQL